MAAPFHFELVSPEKLIFSGEVEAVVVPGMEGEFTVLRDHAPLMSTLKAGVISVENAGIKTELFVRGGFADASPTGLTILAEYALPLEELDSAKIGADIAAAEAEVASAHSDETRQICVERRDQLIELKAALGL